MKLVKGNALTVAQKEHVLKAFIYRWTKENHRRNEVYRNIGKPTMPLQTDEQWLAEHAFYIKNNGELSFKHRHCEPAFKADWR